MFAYVGASGPVSTEKHGLCSQCVGKRLSHWLWPGRRSISGRGMIPGERPSQSVGLLISLLLAEETKQYGSLLLRNYTKLEQMNTGR